MGLETKFLFHKNRLKNVKLLIVISIFFSVVSPLSVYGANLGFTLSQSKSGGIVGALNTIGDDLCPNATTPGCDVSSTDNLVRTNDEVEYQFNVYVGPAGDNPTITTELDPGLLWSELPSICNPFTSALSGDGSASNPSILSCDLGNRSAWSTTFSANARVLGSNPNGTSAGIASASIDAPNSTQINLTSLPTDITVTASPRLNLRKRFRHSSNTKVGGVDYMWVYYTWTLETWKHDTNGNTSDDPDPYLGNEVITGDVTFIEDTTNISPNAYIHSCYAGSSSSSAYPYPTYNTTYPDRSVTNVGTSTCSNTGPTAKGQITVTVSGADLSFTHTPKYTRVGNTLAADRKVASFGTIRILVPITDITAAGGSIASVNRISNLSATSISNQPNFAEDEADNSVARTLVAGSGSWSKLFRHSMVNENEPGKLWWDPVSNASGHWAGDGVIQPGQYFATSTTYNNNTFGPVDEVEICDVIDTNLYEFSDRNNAPGFSHYVYGAMANGGEGTGYSIEYGVGYVGTWPPATYPNPSALNTECTDPSIQWFSTLTAARAVGTPTKIRYKRLTPQPIGAGGLVLKHRVKTNLTQPNGTLLTNMATMRNSLTGMQWRACNYQSGGNQSTPQVGNSCGDRLTLTRTEVRIDKTTEPNDLVNVVQAGGTVKYKLAPTFTSEIPVSDTIFVIDSLPAGLSYEINSAIWNGVQTEPTISGTVTTGQTLTWNLGSWAANGPIPEIEFEARIPITAGNGTQYTNSVLIDAVTDGSTVAQRTDTRLISVNSPASFILGKTTDTPTVEQDTLSRFTVQYYNDTQIDIPVTDIIDILPYNGDNRSPNTSFSGSYAISPLVFDTTNGTAYYTSTTPGSIANDPQDASNAIPGGSTKWCQVAEFGNTNCPNGFSQVTAVRLIDNANLPGQTSRTMTIEFTPNGNSGNDVYTNNAQAYGQGVTLSTFSPNATVNVIENAEIGVAKNLVSQNGADLTFSFVIENVGKTLLSTVSLTDDLDATFGNGNYTITSLPNVAVQPSGGNLTSNSLFTGSGANKNLLDPAGINDLPVGSTATVTLTINLHNLTDQGLGLGVYSNSATAQGTTSLGTVASDISDNGTDPDSNNNGDANDLDENDPTPVNFVVNPLWTLDKETTSTPTKENDVMSYTFTVKNTGNVSISSISLSDAQCDAAPILTSGDLNTNNILEITETWSYSCNHTVTQQEVDDGAVNNTASITGTPNGGTLSDATDIENVTVVANPLISIVKSNPTHTDTDNNGTVTLGDTLTYTITATNDGNVTLNNVVVSDSKITPNSQSCLTVSPNATCILTGEHIVVLADTTAGEVVNTAQVTSDEITNPISSETITTPTVKIIQAIPETFPAVNGAAGGITTSVLASDTLNSSAVNLSDVIITVNTSDPSLILDPTTGLITVASGTAAGQHTVNYTICETLNPTNCSTTTETVAVDVAPIVAIPETFPVVNGINGGVTTSVLASDTLNGVLVAPSDVTITVNASNPNLTLNPSTGLITIAPNTPAGNHTVTYTICENLNPTNCATTTETISVNVAPILAIPETFPFINGGSGGVTPSVLTSDTLNGVSVVASDVTITVDSSDQGLTLDPTTGQITVAAGTSSGSHSITYTICENLNPTNCSTTTETVILEAPSIVAVPDIMAVIDGTSGGTTNLNVLTNDTLNNVVVNPSLITLTEVSSTSPGVTLNPDGSLTVAPGTPAGTYIVEYTICENLNPTNCSTTTATVPVVVNLHPVAENDSKLNQSLGQAVTVQSISNDSDPENSLDPTSVKIKDPSGNPVTTLVVPGEGTWTVDPVNGDITFMPEAGFLNDPTPIDYTVKDTDGLESNIATVTIDYEEPAALTGTVWLDSDKDNQIDSNEDRKSGWTLKVKDINGNIIATTVTDAQGNYSITGLIPDEYTVEFFNTNGTLIASQSTQGALTAGQTMDLPLPVDPSGVVYDSTSRTPIAGVTMQLINSQGISVDSLCVGEGQQNQVTAQDGLYAFDVYPDAHPSCPNGETYTIKIVSAPASYFTDSLIIPPQTSVYDSAASESNCTLDVIANSGSCEVQGQPDAPQGNQDTSYYMNFSLSAGDSNVIFNHIPLDLQTARNTEIADDAILLSKSASKKQVSIGDQLYYTIQVENTTDEEIQVDIRDDIPAGFKFTSSTAKLIRAGIDNSFNTSDDVVTTIATSGGDPINFNSLTLQGNEQVKIGYILKVGTSVQVGNAVNTAQAFAAGSSNDIASNIARATVSIVADSVLDESTLIGKVFHDRDGDGYQDSANASGVQVKSDYFGWNSLNLGAIKGLNSYTDNPVKNQKVIRMPYTVKNDFIVTTAQGSVIKVDNVGRITTAHKGLKRKGLTAQDIHVSIRRTHAIPTQTPLKMMRVPVKKMEVIEITISNRGIHEEGIPGVRIATVEGLLIETDGYGRYHLPNVDGGRRSMGKNLVLKVDPTTLPIGARFTTENPRVLRITSTALNKINFGVQLLKHNQKRKQSPVKSTKKVGGVPSQMVKVELGDSFFTRNGHSIHPSQKKNMNHLAINIKKYKRAEITISGSKNENQGAKRVQTIRQALQRQLGEKLMRNVKFVIDKNSFVHRPSIHPVFDEFKLVK